MASLRENRTIYVWEVLAVDSWENRTIWLGHVQGTDEPALVFESPWDNRIFAAAQKHAQYMADARRQGHQGWEQRWQQLTKDTGYKDIREICAETWPEQALLPESARWDEAVHCWQQSPGHWSVAKRKWAAYGAAMAKGRDGVWYCCIIVAD